MSAAMIGTAVVTPVSAPAPVPAKIAAAVELTALASGLGGVIENLTTVSNGIQGAFNNLTGAVDGVYTNLTVGIENIIRGLTDTINHIAALPDGVQSSLKGTYDSLERWSRYVSDWTQFSLGLLPGLWYIPPGVSFAYNTAEPLARAGAYSFADLVGLDLAQFGRDINEGIATSARNAAIYGKAWAESFVAVPPLPPYPGPWPGADVINPLPAAATTAATVAGPDAAAVTNGIESVIKNTYNAVEPWVAYGFELAQWGMGFVPGLWWVAPGVSLAYFSIEPLVQAGVYTFADVLGLNWSQIGPDIQQGFQQSAQNFVNYGLAWIQSLIPFPPLPPFPPRPGAAVAATTSLRAAAAVGTAEAATVNAATDVAPATGNVPAVDDAQTAPKAAPDAPVGESPQAPEPAPAAEPLTPVADVADPVAESATPAVEKPVADLVAPTVTEQQSEAPAESAAPSRGGLRGHRSPVTRNDAPKAADSAKADHAGRSSR